MPIIKYSIYSGDGEVNLVKQFCKCDIRIYKRGNDYFGEKHSRYELMMQVSWPTRGTMGVYAGPTGMRFEENFQGQ